MILQEIKKILVMVTMIVPLISCTFAKVTAPIRAIEDTPKPYSKLQLTGNLSIDVTHYDGTVEHVGSWHNLIVNTGEQYMVDVFQASTLALSQLRYHAIGDGSAAVAETDTNLGSAFTTELATNSVRCTGTQGQNGSNVYQTICSHVIDAAVVVEEWGLFNEVTVGCGVMWSRVLTGPITLASTDRLTTTYELTVE